MINNYRLEYWMYAIVAKHLGRSVRIERDSLHKMYEVNRHGMFLSSESIPAKQIKNVIVDILVKAGYMLTDGRYYSKKQDGHTVTVSVEENTLMTKEKIVRVLPRVYKN